MIFKKFFALSSQRARRSSGQCGAAKRSFTIPNAHNAVRHDKDRRIRWNKITQKLSLIQTKLHVKSIPLLFSPPDLWYQMMLPPNFKKSKKYPLLIDVWVLTTGRLLSGDRPPVDTDECFWPPAGTAAPAASRWATASSSTGARTSPARTGLLSPASTAGGVATKETKSCTPSTAASGPSRWRIR